MTTGIGSARSIGRTMRGTFRSTTWLRLICLGSRCGGRHQSRQVLDSRAVPIKGEHPTHTPVAALAGSKGRDMKQLIALAITTARAGVDYTRQHGATCPLCGKHRIPVYSSPRWNQGIKTRYHHCNNPNCLLSQIRTSIKSVEIEKMEQHAS
jgi:hypothetical protein